MSAPDWRDTIARALYARKPVGVRSYEEAPADYAEACLDRADAVLDAIKAAGYRLHRDHDWQTTPDIIYAQLVMTCRRCPAVSPGLNDQASCEGEPREEPQG